MQPVLTDSQVAMVLAAAQRDMCLGRWEAATVKLEWLVRANAGVPSASPAVVSTALIPWIAGDVLVIRPAPASVRGHRPTVKTWPVEPGADALGPGMAVAMFVILLSVGLASAVAVLSDFIG